MAIQKSFSGRILRTPGAAEYTALSPATLEKMRSTGGGPRFIRLGGRAIGYDVRDLDAWLNQHRDASAGEVPPSPSPDAT